MKQPGPQIELKHRLRIAREYAGFDQDELAKKISIGRSTVSNAENGKGMPRRITIAAWAMACGVSTDWLLNGEAISA